MLTQKRSAVPFLHGLRRFLDRRADATGDVEAMFVGAREDTNDRAVTELGLGGVVRFVDTASHADTLRAERRSHILLLIKHTNPDYQGLVPGKLYEYVGMRRPILALAPEGEARDIVVSLRRGEVAQQEDPSSVGVALARMYDAHRSGTLDAQYDLDPRPEMTRERRAAEMAALLDDVASLEGGSR
jgi:hypothetical protein